MHVVVLELGVFHKNEHFGPKLKKEIRAEADVKETDKQAVLHQIILSQHGFLCVETLMPPIYWAPTARKTFGCIISFSLHTGLQDRRSLSPFRRWDRGSGPQSRGWRVSWNQPGGVPGPLPALRDGRAKPCVVPNSAGSEMNLRGIIGFFKSGSSHDRVMEAVALLAMKTPYIFMPRAVKCIESETLYSA